MTIRWILKKVGRDFTIGMFIIVSFCCIGIGLIYGFVTALDIQKGDYERGWKHGCKSCEKIETYGEK